MRSSTAGEQTVLAATFRKTYYRVDIESPLGVMVDMASHASYGWLCDVTIDEHIDTPVAGCTVTLRRELDYVDVAGHLSLSPLRTDSAANPDGPQVDVYRDIKVYMAVVTVNRPTALSTDWKLKFDGITDRVSMPDNGRIIVTARDNGAHLIDQWVRDEGANLASNGNPRPLESIINDLLRYAPIDDEVLTVEVPVLPEYYVTSFPLKPESVMQAIQRAVERAAADFRFAWDSVSGSYLPTLTIPDRDTPTSAATFGSSQIVGWRKVDRDRTGVRNFIIVSYRPRTTTGRDFVVAEDATSISSYGRRVLSLQEDDDSSIDTEAEAEDLADLILTDLKDPKAEAECEMLPDWRIEINDYLTFTGNKYFDLDQNLAVVGIRHELTPDMQRTMLTLRGNPSAGYQRWIARAKDLAFRTPTPADNGLSEVHHSENDVAGTRTTSWTRGANVAFVAFYETLAAPGTDAFPDAGSIVGLVAAGTAGASILPSSTDSWVATRPPRGQQRYGIAVPYYKLGGRTVQGDALKMVVDPLPSNMSVSLLETSVLASDGFSSLALLVAGSPSDWPVLVEVWEDEESGAADYSYTVNANTFDADSVAENLKEFPLRIELLGVGLGSGDTSGGYQSINRTWAIKATNVAGEFVRSGFTERRSAIIAGTSGMAMDATDATLTAMVSDAALFRQQDDGAGLAVGFIQVGTGFLVADTNDANDNDPSFTAELEVARDATDDITYIPYIRICDTSKYDVSRGLSGTHAGDVVIVFLAPITVPHA